MEDKDQSKFKESENGSQHKKTYEHFNLKKLMPDKFVVIFLMIGLLTIVILGWRSQELANRPKKVGPTIANQQILIRRSKIPNVITKATTAKVIDVNTGKVIQAARVFTLDDKTIYLSLDLNNPVLNTRIDYIRYLNGRYVDHGSVKVTKPNTQNLVFEWTNNKLLGSRPEGSYKVSTYTNGILEKRVTYTVTKNNVTGFVIKDRSPKDLDYSLISALQTEPK